MAINGLPLCILSSITLYYRECKVFDVYPLGDIDVSRSTPPKKVKLDANGSILILRRAEEEV
jgi:hypothetical protein